MKYLKSYPYGHILCSRRQSVCFLSTLPTPHYNVTKREKKPACGPLTWPTCCCVAAGGAAAVAAMCSSLRRVWHSQLTWKSQIFETSITIAWNRNGLNQKDEHNNQLPDSPRPLCVLSEQLVDGSDAVSSFSHKLKWLSVKPYSDVMPVILLMLDRHCISK